MYADTKYATLVLLAIVIDAQWLDTTNRLQPEPIPGAYSNHSKKYDNA